MEGWSTALAVALLLGAGSLWLGAPMEAAPSEADEAATHHVHIEDFAMDPDPLEIEVGDSVVWHNHDGVSHTATADDGGWDTGTIQPGESKTITFEQARSDTYHCKVHPSSMTGFELEVVEPNEAPTVSIDSPGEGQLLAGETTIEGTAVDPDGTVEKVEVRIDGGTWRTANGTSSWSLAWDTSEVLDGEHTIQARSFDGTDHSAIDAVTVQTQNAHPDLSVVSLEGEAGIDETHITATVRNEGEVDAEATSLQISYEGENADGLAAVEAVAGLEPDEAVTIEATWDTTDKVGEFDLSAHVDPDGDIVDPDPTNDERETTVCVPGAEGLTCLIPGTQAPGTPQD